MTAEKFEEFLQEATESWKIPLGLSNSYLDFPKFHFLSHLLRRTLAILPIEQSVFNYSKVQIFWEGHKAILQPSRNIWTLIIMFVSHRLPKQMYKWFESMNDNLKKRYFFIGEVICFGKKSLEWLSSSRKKVC